jgi:hypothetical protein
MPRSNGDFSNSNIVHASGCLARLGWFMLGPAAMFVAFFAIIQRGNGMSWADGLMGLAMVACLLLRTVDVLYLRGLSASGEPATPADLKRYVVRLIPAVLVLWGVAHGLARLFA